LNKNNDPNKTDEFTIKHNIGVDDSTFRLNRE